MQEGINSSDDDEDVEDEEEDDDNSEEILEDGLQPAQPFPTHSAAPAVPPSVTLAPPTSTLASLAIRSSDSGQSTPPATSALNIPPKDFTTNAASMERTESTSTSLDTATASQPEH